VQRGCAKWSARVITNWLLILNTRSELFTAAACRFLIMKTKGFAAAVVDVLYSMRVYAIVGYIIFIDRFMHLQKYRLQHHLKINQLVLLLSVTACKHVIL